MRRRRLYVELRGRWALLAAGESLSRTARAHLGDRITLLRSVDRDAWLVRPDGHLAWRGDDPDELERWLRSASGQRKRPMTTPARGRPRDPALDTAILTAALDLFVEHGIAGMSIEQVARRAGVGKPTVYRRWSSKEQLVADAIEAFVATGVQWPSREEIDAVGPQELIRRNIDTAARTSADRTFRALVAQIYGSAVTHPLLMRTYWDHYVGPRRALAIAMLAASSKRGLRCRPTPISTCSSTCSRALSLTVCCSLIRPRLGRCGDISNPPTGKWAAHLASEQVDASAPTAA